MFVCRETLALAKEAAPSCDPTGQPAGTTNSFSEPSQSAANFNSTTIFLSFVVYFNYMYAFYFIFISHKKAKLLFGVVFSTEKNNMVIVYL